MFPYFLKAERVIFPGLSQDEKRSRSSHKNENGIVLSHLH
jgi:hypothetical protein